MKLKRSYLIQGIIAAFYLATVVIIMYVAGISYPLYAVILGCCFLSCGILLFLVVHLTETYIRKLNKDLFIAEQQIRAYKIKDYLPENQVEEEK
jgi:membrane protein CcdC involved in cytochrome C biogenesis